jgi:hypothetical protein
MGGEFRHSAMNKQFWTLILIAATVVAGSVLVADRHQDTRQSMFAYRRLIRADHTMIAFKNHYFKQSVEEVMQSGELGMAQIAMRMNQHEAEYRLPYVWGGSIKNHLAGLDCTGFIHGLMYYVGYPKYNKRFNTKAIYLKLRRDRNWLTVFDSAKSTGEKPGTAALKVGDLIVWPSDLDDGRNLPGPIWGHIGVVTTDGTRLLVTHYVHSDAYDHLDVIGTPGSGINTLPAEQFISLKQRGILGVFRSRRTAA